MKPHRRPGLALPRGARERPGPISAAVLALTRLWGVLADAVRRRRAGLPREAGDVPGWVMVTLMSALLVAGLFIVAGPELDKLFKSAISKVSGM